MFYDSDFFKEVFSTLHRKKKRTLVTGLGVWVAIFLLILLMAAGNGLENGVHNRFSNIQTNCLYIYANATELRYKNFPANRPIALSVNDFNAVKSSFGSQAEIFSCRTGVSGIKSLFYGSVSTTCYLSAVDCLNYITRPVTMIQGNYFSPGNLLNKEKVIVIGKTLQTDLFPDDTAVLGKYISLDNAFYKLIGVFGSAKEGESARFDNNSAFIPLSVYNTLYNTQQISEIEIVSNNTRNYQALKDEVPLLLKNIKYINPDDRNAITVVDTKKDFSKYATLFKNIRYFLWFVCLGMLAMGLMNISNVVYITVNERMKEFGVRKSIGASPGSILSMVVFEAVFITLLSGLTGLVTGIAIVRLISWLMNKFKLNNEFFMYPYVNPAIIFSAIAVLIIGGIFAGLIPAVKASRIKPAEVLRNE